MIDVLRAVCLAALLTALLLVACAEEEKGEGPPTATAEGTPTAISERTPIATTEGTPIATAEGTPTATVTPVARVTPTPADVRGGPVEMGIDPDTTGNTADTLGTLESCVRVDVPSPSFDGVSDYSIDVYVKGDTAAPLAFDARVTYDQTKVHITAPGTDTLVKMPEATDLSDRPPDSDSHFVGGVIYIHDAEGIPGDGTLMRLGLDIGAPGVVTFDFSKASYLSVASDPVPHPTSSKTAQLAINEECPP